MPNIRTESAIFYFTGGADVEGYYEDKRSFEFETKNKGSF